MKARVSLLVLSLAMAPGLVKAGTLNYTFNNTAGAAGWLSGGAQVVTSGGHPGGYLSQSASSGLVPPTPELFTLTTTHQFSPGVPFLDASNAGYNPGFDGMLTATGPDSYGYTLSFEMLTGSTRYIVPTTIDIFGNGSWNHYTVRLDSSFGVQQYGPSSATQLSTAAFQSLLPTLLPTVTTLRFIWTTQYYNDELNPALVVNEEARIDNFNWQSSGVTNPTPEPAALFTAGIGLALMAASRRYRRRVQ